MKYKIRVFYWNPNGTNDIEIIDEHGYGIQYIEEALFGLNTGRCKARVFSLKTVSKYIAVSPVSSGIHVVEVLRKYFKKDLK